MQSIIISAIDTRRIGGALMESLSKGPSMWEVLPTKTKGYSYPINTGKTGIAAARREAKRRSRARQ